MRIKEVAGILILAAGVHLPVTYDHAGMRHRALLGASEKMTWFGVRMAQTPMRRKVTV